jgi:cytochrome b involved in lipid metabolism
MWSFGLFSRSQDKPSKEPESSVSPLEKDAQDAILPVGAGRVDEDGGDSDAGGATPKATAIVVPANQVPVLNLNGDLSGAEDGLNEGSYPNEPSKESQSPALDASTTLASSSGMAPPPRPRAEPQQQPSTRPPQTSGGQFLVPPKLKSIAPLRPPPSAASSLRTPPSSRLTSSTLAPPQRNASRQVVLEPGHSPLDWAALASNPNNNLRGANLPSHFIRVTPSMLKAHNGRRGVDAWTSYKGKVYNITPYIPFHPGGKGEILRGAGKDSAKLFMDVHPWVNWDGMLGECLVGILVSENDAGGNSLDAMD